MIGWLNPGAVWALPIAAIPFLIHLLRTHHATRVQFPSLRFVQPSRIAAVRMRLPSDVLLMLVRIAIVALGVGALAGPIVLTDARVAAWNSRTARAVVVDVSGSMRVPDGSGAAPQVAAEDAAAAELRSATYGRRIDARDLEEGLARASAWLATSPPSRREVVVISDLQRGAVGRTSTGSIPDGAGVRFVQVGRRVETTTFDGTRLMGAADVAVRDQSIEATVDTTAVAIQSRAGEKVTGLRLVAPVGAEQSLARLLRVVATAGTPAGSTDQPIAIQFAGATTGTIAAAPIRAGWMLGTILRLLDDPAVIAATSRVSSTGPVRTVESSRPDPWTILAMTSDGSPLLRAAAFGSELVVEVGAPPDGLLAAEVVRAVLTARLEPAVYDEQEVGRLDDALLTALTRSPESVTRDAWRTADATDARWFWLLALALLGVEQWLRVRSADVRHQEVTRAAA